MIRNTNTLIKPTEFGYAVDNDGDLYACKDGYTAARFDDTENS